MRILYGRGTCFCVCLLFLKGLGCFPRQLRNFLPLPWKERLLLLKPFPVVKRISTTTQKIHVACRVQIVVVCEGKFFFYIQISLARFWKLLWFFITWEDISAQNGGIFRHDGSIRQSEGKSSLIWWNNIGYLTVHLDYLPWISGLVDPTAVGFCFNKDDLNLAVFYFTWSDVPAFFCHALHLGIITL